MRSPVDPVMRGFEADMDGGVMDMTDRPLPASPIMMEERVSPVEPVLRPDSPAPLLHDPVRSPFTPQGIAEVNMVDPDMEVPVDNYHEGTPNDWDPNIRMEDFDWVAEVAHVPNGALCTCGCGRLYKDMESVVCIKDHLDRPVHQHTTMKTRDMIFMFMKLGKVSAKISRDTLNNLLRLLHEVRGSREHRSTAQPNYIHPLNRHYSHNQTSYHRRCT